MRGTNSRTRFSYADDTGILGISRTIANSAAAAQWKVNNLLDCANENAVSIDLTQTKVVQFPGCGREDLVGLTLNGINFEPDDYTRWLGVTVQEGKQ